MKRLGDVKRHVFLVKRMARATGADLDRALRDGRLGQAGWAAAVTRCRGCACADSCETWLTRAELAGRKDLDAPGGCENRTLFRQLSHQVVE